MTGQVLATANGIPAGATVTIEPRGKLTRDGRIHRVLTIDGKPAAPDLWIVGRTLALV